VTALQQIRLFTGGWGDILFGRPSWREKFELTTGGLAVAVLVFLAAVGMQVSTIYTIVGGATISTVAQAVLISVMRLFGLMLAMLLTYIPLRVDRPMLELLVPGVYALALTLMLGTLLVIFSPLGGLVALASLALMMWRAARVVGSFGVGVSMAFAALVVVLLVVLNDSLYMLMAATPQPVSGI